MDTKMIPAFNNSLKDARVGFPGLPDANKVAAVLGVKFDKFTPDALLKGINTELEHGTAAGKYNITNDDLTMTAKIALAHLTEYPDYYERLDKMENGDFMIGGYLMVIIVIVVILIIIAIVLYYRAGSIKAETLHQ